MPRTVCRRIGASTFTREPWLTFGGGNYDGAHLVAFLLAGVAAASAGELQGKSIDFLKELGLDPASSEIVGIVDDQVGKYSLDALAAKRDEDGVKAFIATRNFIRTYQQNTATPFPPIDLYVIRYLKPDEAQFISAQLIKELTPAKQ